MAPRAHKEATVSIRLVWPFARLIASYPEAAASLTRIGIRAEEFASPDTRLPHSLVMQLLEETLRLSGDPAIGWRAGEQVDARDFDVLESAARCSATLGDAMQCMARYFRLMHDAAEISLHNVGDVVEWRFRILDGVHQPPAANDFVIASALSFSRRNCTTIEPPVEVSVMHEPPSYAAEYESWVGARVRFGAPCNTIVLRKERLTVPMLRANPAVSAAFERHARQLLAKLRQSDGVAGRVREQVTAQLGTGSVTMRGTATRLAMSVATLRRRLEEEDETFAGILDDLRKQLAEKYLGEPSLTISEVAFLLGFANAAAFNRAFKRWTGLPPAAYRKAQRV